MRLAFVPGEPFPVALSNLATLTARAIAQRDELLRIGQKVAGKQREHPTSPHRSPTYCRLSANLFER